MDRLFLLEDDRSLIDGLRYSLEKNGFRLTVARTVGEAMERLERTEDYDLLLLDVSLPDGTGFDVCRQVRAQDADIPIIFLTAADEETNVIRGLDGGGDDYITKPFRLGELCSRIRAQLRRSGRPQERERKELRSGGLFIDLLAGRAYMEDRMLELTAAEYRLLCLLVENEGRVLTRNRILDALWDGNGSFVDDNTLSVYVRRLREKLEEDPSAPAHLLTVRGRGYEWKGQRRG
ncbi:response regulator transcription factor [Faecalicatena contorta]|uniref:response regulator transcription factor n=1 Tax=Faecalicatena contorta TaxID=39482 RepID=UPI00195F9044|nr:response regulator transcription factor [Faecalicatena contorta]MBM6684468.1 response regulator transcription factor [Faecalicatena contorta]MBM6709219.1 response regulator transcription factor [Faecalicatena contorta]